MIRAVLLLMIFLVAQPGSGVAQTLYPARNGGDASRVVTVYSSIDEAIALPLIDAFRDTNPALAVRYVEAQTVDIYERIVQESDAGKPTADIAISSAMDLQMKLANDGYARRVSSLAPSQWPKWANWRDSAIGLTYEPAVIVYHKPDFASAPPPQTRAELEQYLRANGNELQGRIGTYDIERAGVGLLFLARDIENHRDIWSLVRAMGGAGVKLYSTSSAILERVADGRFALGYNILGSYAAEWAKTHSDIGIVMPRDYTVVMTRVAVIPARAPSPDLGELFLKFLMSPNGQKVMAEQCGLPAIHPAVDGPNTATTLIRQMGGQLRPAPLTPALMVYLDQAKRGRVVARWNKELRSR